MSHTKGKWIYCKHKEQDEKKDRYLVIQAKTHDAANIAMVIPCAGMSKEEHEANAQLIAAAPDLLEACKDDVDIFNKIQNLLPEEDNLDYDPGDILMQIQELIWKTGAEAAINKAKGK